MRESVDVLDDDRLLAQALHQRAHFLQIFLTGLLSGDDLAQGQQVGRIQPVLAHEALRILAGLGDLGNVEAGGVGGKQGLGGGDFGDLPEEALFDIHPFHGGFHHQAAVPEAVLVHGEDHAVQGGLGLFGGDKTLFDHHLLIQGDEVFAFFDAHLVDVVDPGLVSRQGIHLR